MVIWWVYVSTILCAEHLQPGISKKKCEMFAFLDLVLPFADIIHR